MEACSGAHHWARLFRRHGHSVKLMAPKFVTPYRMGGKRGKKREACPWGTTLRTPPPSLRPSPGPRCALSPSKKSTSRSSCACTARALALSKSAPRPITGCAACAEFGIVLPQKVTCLRHGIGAHLEALPGYANRCIGDLLACTIPELISVCLTGVSSNHFRRRAWDSLRAGCAAATDSG